MDKRVLLIGYNYFPEPTGIGKYSGEMIQWLADRGYDCTVVAAYPYYPFWKVQEPYYEQRNRYLVEQQQQTAAGGRITVHRCPMYIPATPTGLKRMLLDFSFLVSAFFKVVQLSFKQKHDVVMTVAPSFQFGLLGIFYKKLKSAKFIYHIHDMQIEAARDLNMIKSEGLVNALLKVEKHITDEANVVSSVSEQMVEKIETKAKKEVVLFPNWVDDKRFFPILDRNELKTEFGFAASDIIVLYSGAIGEKQGLESIIYAAQEFREQPAVKFLICGSGPYKEKLMSLVAELKLDNVIFFPLQSVEKFNKFLNIADLHLVIQKANASDLMMPSKLTTILAVGGLALITANEGSGLHKLVQKHAVGLLAEAESQPALNKAIAEAIRGGHDAIRANAREYARNYLFIDKIMTNFEQHLR